MAEKQRFREKVKGYFKNQWRMFKAETAALGRQGTKDFRNILMGPWGEGVEEPGTLANPTQQQVTESFEKQDDGKTVQGNSKDLAKAQKADGQSKGKKTTEMECQDKVDKVLLRKRGRAQDGPSHE